MAAIDIVALFVTYLNGAILATFFNMFTRNKKKNAKRIQT